MTVAIHTLGGFTYLAEDIDIPVLKKVKGDGTSWTFRDILDYSTVVYLIKAKMVICGNPTTYPVHDVTIRGKDIVSIENISGE